MANYKVLTSNLSGSLNLTGSINLLNGSLVGSASYSTTSSAATSITFVPSTASYASVAPYGGLTGVPSGIYSSSTQLPSGLISSSTQLPTGTVSSSVQINTGSFTGSFVGSLQGSASFATTASAATTITFVPSTSSFATTSSAATSLTFTPVTSSYAATSSYFSGNELLVNTPASGTIRIGDIAASSFTDTGVLLPGKIPAGIFTEVSGSILSYAINQSQIGTRNNSIVGGIFRLDTRTTLQFSGGAQSFIVFGNPTGGDSEVARLIVSLQDGTTALAPVAGNVGIGTTSPGAKLHVAGGISGSSLVVTNQVTASAFKGDGAQVTGVISSSFATSASWAPGGVGVSASYATTASYSDFSKNAGPSVSSSYSTTSSYSDFSKNAGPSVSSSYATTASYATLAQDVLGSIESASYSATSSLVNRRINIANSIVADSGSVIASGTLRAQGPVTQTALGFDRLDLGVLSGTPRIVFENNDSLIWQIDNEAGGGAAQGFRWYTPNQVRMNLTDGGILTVGYTAGVSFSIDNTYDIGSVSSGRPKTGYFGTSVVSPLFSGTASYATTAKSSSYSLVAPYSGLTDLPSGLVSSSVQINTGSFSASLVNGLRVYGPTGSTGNWLGLFTEQGVTPDAAAIITPEAYSRALSVQGAGAAYIMGRDVTNDIEFLFGTSVNGVVFVGSMTNHDLQLRTQNISRLAVFGNPTANIIHIFGAVTASSYTSSIQGSPGFIGTGSWAVRATSASYSTTSSYAATAQTVLGTVSSASYASLAATASYFSGSAAFESGLVVTGSITASIGFQGSGSGIIGVISSSYATSASWAPGGIEASASYATTSSYSEFSKNAGPSVSASYATTASYATLAQDVLGSIASATSASYALTASYAANAAPSISASFATTASKVTDSNVAYTNINNKFTAGQTITGSLIVSSSATTSSSLAVIGSGSTILSVDGALGRLLEITDDLANSLFSANNISGLPVIEAFADNTVRLGKFGEEGLVVTGSGKDVRIGSGSKLFVSASGLITATGPIVVTGPISASGFSGSVASSSYSLTSSAATSITFVPTTSSFAVSASWAPGGMGVSASYATTSSVVTGPLGNITASGLVITSRTTGLTIGDIPSDYTLNVSFASASSYGFSTTFDIGSDIIIRNDQGSTNQVLVLPDTSGSDHTLMGLGVSQNAGSSWDRIFDFSGLGNIRVPGKYEILYSTNLPGYGATTPYNNGIVILGPEGNWNQAIVLADNVTGSGAGTGDLFVVSINGGPGATTTWYPSLRLSATGSLWVRGAITASAGFVGDGSKITGVVSSSYATSASWAPGGMGVSASYATTASYSDYSKNAGPSVSASYATTSSYASVAEVSLQGSLSASYATTSSYSVSASWAPGGVGASASYATTSSFATNAGPIVSLSVLSASSGIWTEDLVVAGLVGDGIEVTGSLVVTGSVWAPIISASVELWTPSLVVTDLTTDIGIEVTGSLAVSGTVTASKLNITEGVTNFRQGTYTWPLTTGPTGSVLTVDGATGNLAWTAKLTGSVDVAISASYALTSSYFTGSISFEDGLIVTGSITASGGYYGTSSYSYKSISSSYSVTSSYATNAGSAGTGGEGKPYHLALWVSSSMLSASAFISESSDRISITSPLYVLGTITASDWTSDYAPSGALEVSGNLWVSGNFRTEPGYYVSTSVAYIGGALYSHSVVIVGAGTSSIAAFDKTVYSTYFADYVITTASLARRAGTARAAWLGNSLNYDDTPVTSIGNTSGVVFSASFEAANVQVNIMIPSGSWTVKTLYRVL